MSGYFQKIGRAGYLDHHCVMTHKLHADAGSEKIIALLAMNEETQMETLSYDDAVVAPTMNAITSGERYTGGNMGGCPRIYSCVSIRQSNIIR